MTARLPTYWIVFLFQVGLFVTAAILLWVCGLTICPFRLLTGWPCLCCGMTHAWIACCKGNFSAAFQAHPGFWLAVPAAMAFIARKKRWGRMLWQSRVFWLTLLTMLIVCYAWRLLKYFPNGPYPMTWDKKNLLSMLKNYFQR